MSRDLVLIADGQTRWCGAADAVERAVEALGWEWRWTRPPHGVVVEPEPVQTEEWPEGEPGLHYRAFCDLVPQADGYTTGDSIDPEDARIHATMEIAPATEPHGRAWTFTQHTNVVPE